jgi:hypothetical protein
VTQDWWGYPNYSEDKQLAQNYSNPVLGAKITGGLIAQTFAMNFTVAEKIGAKLEGKLQWREWTEPAARDGWSVCPCLSVGWAKQPWLSLSDSHSYICGETNHAQ